MKGLRLVLCLAVAALAVVMGEEDLYEGEGYFPLRLQGGRHCTSALSSLCSFGRRPGRARQQDQAGVPKVEPEVPPR